MTRRKVDPEAVVVAPRRPLRSVGDPDTRLLMRELHDALLGARIAHDLRDDDQALAQLEQTAGRATRLARLLRSRLGALPDSSLRWSA
jgi:hypothetical protein